MYEPHTYPIALSFMIVAMMAWGSWANTQKLVPKFPFQLFYWDYVIGLLVATVLFGLTLGSLGHSGPPFVDTVLRADHGAILYAIASGAIFNVANLLLVAAIAVAGLAVAFPVGIGLALIVGVVLNYVQEPTGNPLLLFGGVALIICAIVLDAIAFRLRDRATDQRSTKGLALALACGVLMGLFYPLIVRAQAGSSGLNSYTVSFWFAMGVSLCALPVNVLLMRRPVDGGPPTSFPAYFAASTRTHLSGILGGLIWGMGLILSLLAGSAALVGPAVSYAVGQGATMVSAGWGVFIWREFAAAPHASRRLLLPMFLFFLAGLAAVAIAPLFES